MPTRGDTSILNAHLVIMEECWNLVNCYPHFVLISFKGGNQIQFLRDSTDVRWYRLGYL